jgi:hypothetical protein
MPQKEILHYEIGNTYGEFTKGFRFDVERDHAHSPDYDIKRGLAEAMGIETNKVPALTMLKLQEI